MALPEEKHKRVELVEGELVVNPAPFIRHQFIVGKIFYALQSFLLQHRLGHALMAPVDVVLSREIVLQPDVIVLLGEHPTIMQWKNLQIAPDIAVEVLSERTRHHDVVAKRRLYERHGVKEIWVVDADEESVTVIRDGQEIFVTDAITTPLLPGFATPLHDVFAE